MLKNREAGAAVIVTVLFVGIVLIGILTISASLALRSRSNTANEALAFQAVLAAESGANSFLSRSNRIAPYGGATPTTCTAATSTETSTEAQARFLCSFNAWLATYYQTGATATDVEAVGNFSVNDAGTAQVVLTALKAEVTSTVPYKLTALELQATSTVSNSSTRVLQRFAALKNELGYPNLPGAVTSWPSVDLNGNAEIAGYTAQNASNDGILQNRMYVTRQNGNVLTTGTPVMVNIGTDSVSQAYSSQASVGSYIRLPLSNLAGTLTGTEYGTFKVLDNSGTALSLQPVTLPSISGGAAIKGGSVGLDLIMNGLRSYDAGTNRLNIAAREMFVKGDTVAMTVGGVRYINTVTSTALNPDGTQAVMVTANGWKKNSTSSPDTYTAVSTPSNSFFDEGSVVTKSTNAVVTAGTFDGGGSTATSGGVVTSSTYGAELVPSPLNNQLFTQTFGMTPNQLKSMSTQWTESTFNGNMTGLNWVSSSDGSINANASKMTGTGVVVFAGDLTINQSGGGGTGNCDFKGIIYVRGNLNIQGNLELCGAVVVEGSIISPDGLTVTNTDSDDTDFAGTGRKVSYNPDYIMDAVAGAGNYSFTPVTSTWRQR
ncbi:hypothetical protein [Deinococcus navajonensis]|uniref:Type 4 fimbrial biogenesis protein PilX N-terminal domain-containing protein n=1 Tax=Deinococcus navajonensis TaxID=309884 RepID=A0ABV8XPI5_9DEIO